MKAHLTNPVALLMVAPIFGGPVLIHLHVIPEDCQETVLM